MGQARSLLLAGALVLGQAGVAQGGVDLAAIDRFVSEQLRAQRVPGVALAIVRGDEVLHVAGYGSAGGGREVGPDTRFLVGSLSKSFTALAVMQLVESGEVDLDAPVRRYLPDFTLAEPGAAERITVRHLLNQTSGLADAGFPVRRGPPPASLAERVRSLGSARPVAPAGSGFAYFNPNYEVLARVVEVVGGRPFPDHLRERLFAPLGMDDTSSLISSAELPGEAADLAQGHLNVYGLPVASPEESGFLGGSGGVVSTARDLANYLVMQSSGGSFRGERVVAPELLALTHTPPPGSEYAMGWFATARDGTRVLEHNGVLSTFYAEAVLLPESGYGLVLLYDVHSVAHATLGFPTLKEGLVSLLMGAPPRAGGLTVGGLGLALGGLTLLGAFLGARSLALLPSWRARARGVPRWRLLPRIALGLVPLVLALTMPAIVLRSAGRAFGFATLFRSMVGVMTWLGVTGVLGAVNGLARLVWLARRR